MSFSGKRYKRTRYENMEDLLTDPNVFGDAIKFLQNNAPIFCFTKIDNNIYNYSLEADGRHISFNFTLGEEKILERRDGEKIKMIFTMPSDNIIHQVITLRNGKVVNFIREFSDTEAKAIVTVDCWNNKQGIIYFEAVE